MGHNQEGKSSLSVVFIAAVLSLILVFALSKIIPRPNLSSRPSKITPSPATSPSPQEANTYTNSAFNFSLSLPENWQTRDNIAPSLPHRLLFVGFAPKVTPQNILASVEVKDQPLDEVITNFRSEVSQSSNSRIVHEREVRLVNRLVKQITVGDLTTNTETNFRFLSENAQAYIISGIGVSDSSLQSAVTSVLDSFTFITTPKSPK